MKKLRILMLITAEAATAAVLIIRFQCRKNESMISGELAVEGIKNGIALECGDTIDDIYISIPGTVSPDEIISVSSNLDIAYLALDKEESEYAGVIKGSIKTFSCGIAEIYVCTSDGEIISDTYKINVVNGKGTETTVTMSSGDVTNQIEDGVIWVYVTPSGKKYHLSESCAGKNGSKLSLEEAVKRGFEPCQNCAMKK